MLNTGAPEQLNLFIWKVLAIVGATLGFVGWIRFLRLD
jgi:hypothetical protein